MNFKELLQHPVERVDFDPSVLTGSYYDHIEGVDLHNLSDDFRKQERISIHYLKDFDFDGRRVWVLFYVKFDDKVVMICKNAGREGDDHHGNKIFDVEVYKSMLQYIKSFEVVDDGGWLTQGNLEDDASEFINFYGNSLTGTFERY